MSSKIDKESILALAEILKDTKLTEISYETDEVKIRVSLAGSAMPTFTIPQQFANAGTADGNSAPTLPIVNNANILKSPLVGTAYTAPQPDAAPYIKIGDSVAAGQTVLIIEAMKVLNPIKAHKAGKITTILVNDGEPVEFNTSLMIIE